MVDDLFDDAALRQAFASSLGFTACSWGAAGWAFERRRLGLRRVEAGPVGLYAGLCRSAEAVEALKARLDAARRSPLTRLRVNLNPLEAHADALTAHARQQGYAVVANETHLLQLAPTMEETRRRYHATKRSQVARPMPASAVITRGSTAAHLDDYFAAYEASLRRWGHSRPLYPRPLFEALMASESASLWMSYVAGRLACAMVVLSCRHYALYWQGVSQIDAEQKSAFPMVRLMDAVLADLTRAGVPCLNLGASDGLPNVRRFKEEFGGQPRAYASLVHEALAWRTLNAARGLR